MINFKIFYNKFLIKYVIIFLALFTAIISLFIYFEYTNIFIEKKVEAEKNRTLYLTFNKDFDYNRLINKYKSIVLDYECSDNNCILIFDKTLSAIQFKNDNINDIEKVLVNEITNNENNYIIKTVLIVLIIISCIIFLILLFLFSKNIIYNFKKDIALYKLIGFSNLKIYNIIFKFLGAYYFILFIISNILSYFILYIAMDINIVFKFSWLINCMLIVFLCLLVSFIQLAFKIKKITPIELINDNN